MTGRAYVPEQAVCGEKGLSRPGEIAILGLAQYRKTSQTCEIYFGFV